MWLQFIAGIGVGTLVAKILDIVWLQRRQEDAARRAWLRDRRLDAFAEVIKEFLPFGLHDAKARSGLQSYGSIAKALLLIEDKTLAIRLDHFIVDMDAMNSLTDSDGASSSKGKQMYDALSQEARDIADEMRNIVLREQEARRAP